MSPVNTEHGGIAGNLASLLAAQLGGRVLVKVGAQTAGGVFAPDVAWCSEGFWQARRNETPLQRAPELCVEISSPSNTIHDLRAKALAYIDSGAREAWIVFPKSRRLEFRDSSGIITTSSFALDLSRAFD